ncbi:MAG: VWA domain-containing protein [Gammaproteobacteria bacterium]
MSARGKGKAPAHVRRWRLVLGRYAQDNLGDDSLNTEDRRMERALDYLYGRELSRRGLRQRKQRSGFGSLDPSQLTPLRWLNEVSELFPASVFETIQRHALERYGLHSLLADPKTLDALEPNRALLKTLLAYKGQADPAVRDKIREVARRIVEEIVRRLKPRVSRALAGAPNRFRRSQFKAVQNFDWRATIRDNLEHYDPQRQVIIARRLHFYSRMRRRLPWTVVLCVDQSASMVDSVIHSAVMAAILSGLPSLKIHLVLFDTSVVDLSEQLDDPVDVLMSVQLGGGTDIGKAMSYCEQLVTQPTRTVCVLISDFEEGAPVARLLGAVRRMHESRITLLGLAALDDEAAPDYDRATAEQLTRCGMQIAALTPDRFADWLAGVIR